VPRPLCAQSAQGSRANGLNELASVDGTLLGYDANGNLLSDGRLVYRYNYRNQLVSAALQSNGVEVLRLSYDATGRLVRIDENGQFTQCVHNVIEEFRAGTLASEYVYEDGVDCRCQVSAAGSEQWYHRDLAESTRWLSDAGGHFLAAARIDYGPSGRRQTTTTFSPVCASSLRWGCTTPEPDSIRLPSVASFNAIRRAS
jgi:uncharacterized protein RhaS with RHS repeats